MANIITYLNRFMAARKGKDVKQDFHDCVLEINKEVEDDTALANETKVRQNLLEQKYDEQIAELANQSPQLPEIVDSRQGFNTLGSIIKQKVFHFNSVADMKNCLTLLQGDVVQTLGYYEADDSGAGLYKIVNDATLEDDGGSVHVLENGLKAQLIIKNSVNIKVFGAIGNGIIDDSIAFQNALDNANTIILNKNETYMLEGPVYLNSNNILEGNDCKITSKSDYSHYRVITTKNIDDANFEHENIKLKKINFDFDNVPLTSSNNRQPRGYLSFRNVNNLVLENIKIENNVSEVVSESENEPIWLYNCSNVKVKKCNCSHVGRQYSGAGGVFWAFFNKECKNYEIDNCDFYAYGDEPVGFITVVGGSIRNVSIHDSDIKTSSRNAIAFANLSSVQISYNKSIINIFNNNIVGDIVFDDYTENINIHDNKNELTKIDDLYTAHNLINFYNSSNHIRNLSIQNNYFINNYNDANISTKAIQISTNSKNTIITNNKFYNFTSIAITNQNSTTTIHSNYFENNVVDIYSVQPIEIRKNIFNSTEQASINLWNNGIVNTEIAENIFNSCEKAILLKITASIYNRPLIIKDNKFYLDINNIYVDDESTTNILPKTLITSNIVIKGDGTSGNLVTDSSGYLSNRMNLYNNYKYTQNGYAWSLIES